MKLKTKSNNNNSSNSNYKNLKDDFVVAKQIFKMNKKQKFKLKTFNRIIYNKKKKIFLYLLKIIYYGDH